jgi:ketosteroid isomerase-like protein
MGGGGLRPDGVCIYDVREAIQVEDAQTMANDFLFDDCLICDAVKDAERKGRGPSEGELRRAFAAQAAKQRVKKQAPRAQAGSQPVS